MWTPEPADIITAEQRAAEAKKAMLVPLSPRQLRLVMLGIGITTDDIENQILSIEDETERSFAEIEWRWATQYDRNHWLVEYLRHEMQFEVDEFDDLWIWAASL